MRQQEEDGVDPVAEHRDHRDCRDPRVRREARARRFNNSVSVWIVVYNVSELLGCLEKEARRSNLQLRLGQWYSFNCWCRDPFAGAETHLQ